MSIFICCMHPCAFQSRWCALLSRTLSCVCVCLCAVRFTFICFPFRLLQRLTVAADGGRGRAALARAASEPCNYFPALLTHPLPAHRPVYAWFRCRKKKMVESGVVQEEKGRFAAGASSGQKLVGHALREGWVWRRRANITPLVRVMCDGTVVCTAQSETTDATPYYI